MPSQILDPTGRSDTIARPVLAPRPCDLVGATVGLLENTKQNAAPLLAELGRLLRERHGVVAVVMRTKAAFALPVDEDLRKELAGHCDGVITGVGDCGSCSASAIADGVALETAGVPAAVICSDAFTVTAEAMARMQGTPDYRYLTTPHPVAVLDADAVRQRARELLPGVVSLLTAAPGPVGRA